MIRKTLSTTVLMVLAIVIVMLAIANRHRVTLSIDPFSSEAPAFALTLPLFLVILLTLIAGAVIGGIAAWLEQSKWRRAARRTEAELKKLRAETDTLRARLTSAELAALPQPARPPIARRM